MTKNDNSICPSCGYCKSCGRGKSVFPDWTVYPTIPYPTSPWYTITYGSSGTTSGTTSLGSEVEN